jgi:hypothetical protein
MKKKKKKKKKKILLNLTNILLLIVQNKAPAAVQITAEQILREAHERQDAPFKQPRQNITDPEELAEYQ